MKRHTCRHYGEVLAAFAGLPGSRKVRLCDFYDTDKPPCSACHRYVPREVKPVDPKPSGC